MNKSNILWILATCIVVIGVIIYIIKGISNETSENCSSNSNTETYESSSSSNSQISPNTLNRNSYLEPIIEKSIHKESEYKGNQLQNGSSPFDACFGKGIYSGKATLTIKNGADTDAIVCLYSISKKRTIRNEYVRKNSSFRMDNIAQGNYKIRVLYGNDWNPTLENACGSKGYFESDLSFSEFDRTEFFEDNNKGYTVATITLYAVVGGNATTSNINQSDFFGN